MKIKEAIYSSLKIIEENLHSDISVQSISEHLGFSFYYFSRLFKGITGFSPKTYILRRKMSEALQDVLDGEKKIIEIAFDYGFSTPESFSRAFQKVTGSNPSEIRKQKTINKKWFLSPMTKEKIEQAEKIENQTPEIVELDPIYLVGIPFYFSNTVVDDLSDPWSTLTKNSSMIQNRILPERYYQVQYWFPDQDINSIFFFVSLQVENVDNIPIPFTAKTLPKQKYLKFLHRGRSNQVGYTYQYIYNEWLPETDYKLPHFYNFEFYGDKYAGPYDENSISEIYIPVE